jgi:hypothetical protein
MITTTVATISKGKCKYRITTQSKLGVSKFGGCLITVKRQQSVWLYRLWYASEDDARVPPQQCEDLVLPRHVVDSFQTSLQHLVLWQFVSNIKSADIALWCLREQGDEVDSEHLDWFARAEIWSAQRRSSSWLSSQGSPAVRIRAWPRTHDTPAST